MILSLAVSIILIFCPCTEFFHNIAIRSSPLTTAVAAFIESSKNVASAITEKKEQHGSTARILKASQSPSIVTKTDGGGDTSSAQGNDSPEKVRAQDRPVTDIENALANASSAAELESAKRDANNFLTFGCFNEKSRTKEECLRVAHSYAQSTGNATHHLLAKTHLKFGEIEAASRVVQQFCDEKKSNCSRDGKPRNRMWMSLYRTRQGVRSQLLTGRAVSVFNSTSSRVGQRLPPIAIAASRAGAGLRRNR